MDNNILNKRIEDIQKAIEQSALQHHILLGRLEEAKYFLEQNNIQELIDNNPGKVIPEKKSK